MTPRISNAADEQRQPVPAAQRDGHDEPANLSVQYGTIGIQAVAAAARYSGVRKNPAARPALRIDLRFVESAG